MLVGSCCGECQSIRVKLRVHVDVTIRSWMRALVSPVCSVRRWSTWSTPSVDPTAPKGVRTRSTRRWVIVTGATVSTSLLVYTAAGDWAWMQRCLSSMKLLRLSAARYDDSVCS